MSFSPVLVIVNPAAGRGRGARLLPAVRAAFAAVGVSDIRLTVAPGDEQMLTARALDDGCRTLVAVGGDGTWSNVADALLRAGAGADCRLALVAAGTGNDFAKSVGAPGGDVAVTARLAVEGPDRRVDVGRIEERHFLNAVGFGFDVAVIEDVARLRWLRGDALYIYSALRQLLGYRGLAIDARAVTHAADAERHLMVVVANAPRFGGAFRIAPGASLGDGCLDAVAIHDAPAWRRLRLFAGVLRGTHLGLPGVTHERAPSFTLRFPAPPAYEVDGELRRASSADVDVACVPGALRVVAPAPHDSA